MYKKMIIVAGGLCLWMGALSGVTGSHSSRIDNLSVSVSEIKSQYAEYDAKLAEIILKQDERITLLETLLERNYGQ